MTNRNLKGLFFKMSGYVPQEVDEMIYRQKAMKQASKEQKERRQAERRLVRNAKHNKGPASLSALIQAKHCLLISKKKSKPERLKEQIQNGLDLAKRWAAE